MKFVMFTFDDGRKLAVNRDEVASIEESKCGGVAINMRDDDTFFVREDFATAHSRLNILEG